MGYLTGTKNRSPSTYEQSPAVGSGMAVPPGLVATYYGDNGADTITVSDSVDTPLVTITGILAAAGQKIIVHATVNYTSIAGNGTIFTGIFISQPPGPPVIQDGVENSTIIMPSQTVTRVFEVPVTSTGSYTVQLDAICQDGATSATVLGKPPSVSPSARLTVEVVSV